MTLKNRNRIFLVFSLLTAATTAAYTAIVLYAALTDGITPPENPVRLLPPRGEGVLFRYDFPASIAAVFVFVLYVPVVALIVSRGFGNTQSLELIFFGGFLLACMAEGVRLLVPLFGLWQSYSLLLVITGRVIITGRTLSFLSILFASLFNETDQRQNVEQNFVILILVALLIGLVMPLNTSLTSSACTVMWGYRPQFFVVRLCVFLLTELTLVISILTKGNRELIKTAVAYPLLMAGYSLLCVADNYLFLGAGTILLVAGTTVYLNTIHSMYMWH